MSTTWTLLSQRIQSWKTENGDHRPPPAKVKLSGFPAEAVRAQEGDLRLRTDTHSRPRAARARLHSGSSCFGCEGRPALEQKRQRGPRARGSAVLRAGDWTVFPEPAQGASGPVRRRSTPPGRLSPAWEEPELAPRGQQTSPRDRVFCFFFPFLFSSLLPLFSGSVVSNSFATPWTVARQAPLSMGFSRQEHWSGLPCPPPAGIKPCVS